MGSTPRECTCGSGEPCWPMRDGYGIFLTYVCDDCIACKRILEATRQQDLFIEKPKPAKQEAML